MQGLSLMDLRQEQGPVTVPRGHTPAFRDLPARARQINYNFSFGWSPLGVSGHGDSEPRLAVLRLAVEHAVRPGWTTEGWYGVPP